MRPDLITHVINTLRHGAAAEELSAALTECVDRANDTGKVATLTLILKIKPEGRGGQYLLHDEVKTKLPALDKGGTLLFGTPDGNLQRQDPRQAGLDLKRIPDEPKPTPKQVNGD